MLINEITNDREVDATMAALYAILEDIQSPVKTGYDWQRAQLMVQ